MFTCEHIISNVHISGNMHYNMHMPALTETSLAVRKLQVFKIFTALVDGTAKTVEEACQQCGITTDVYQHWAEEYGQEIYEESTQAIAQVELDQIIKIASAQNVILAHIVSLATSDGVNGKFMLDVLKYLDDRRKSLETKHGMLSRHDEAAEYVKMTGPNTRVEVSKIAEREEDTPKQKAEVNIRPNTDGSVTVTVEKSPTIVDG